VTKPFGTAELMARVRAALRIRMLSGDITDTSDGVYRVEDLTIDCARRIVTTHGTEVKLTQTEFNILTLLAQHRGKVLTYSTMIRSIWGCMDEGSIKKLQVNMANIRKKLGIKPGDNRYFINELGVGYRMLEE
jgi:two-component system KDP operon response regulator KdpE